MTTCRNCSEYIQFDDDVRSTSGKCIPLDESGEKHQCSARAYSIKCRSCNAEISFDDEHVSSSGKKIPQDSNGNHNCRPYVCKCKDCGVELVFSENEITESGKHIPLTKKSGAHHRCSAKPFNKDTRKDWWYEQERKAHAQREQYRQAYNAYQSRTSESKELEYCKILEIPLTANNQMIRDAYRKKALIYHPDRNPIEKWDWANDMMVKLNDAYEHVLLTAK